MSKIKIQGHSSGNGLVTITTPNTENSTTLTIPDITGTAITSGDTGTVTQAIVHPDAVNRFISGRKNLIINGGFDVWQRGVSFTADNVHTADRWKSGDGTGGSPARTATRQSFTVGQTDVPNEPTYYLRHDQTGASTNGNSSISYNVEGVRTGAGQQVTFSFYSKASSPLTYRIRIIQNFGSSGSADVTNYDTNHSIGTTWAKTTITTTLPSISGKTIGGGDDTLTINIECTSTSTYTFDLAQAQLEIGDQATDFEHRSYGEELALCQRYYFDSRAGTGPADSRYMGLQMAGTTSTSSRVAGGHSFPVQMRDIPATYLFSPSGTAGKVAVYNNNQTDVGHGFYLDRVSKMGWAFVDTSSGASLTGSLRYIYEVIADAEL
jgi:hypothetical protein